jgi:hypothetical protein
MAMICSSKILIASLSAPSLGRPLFKVKEVRVADIYTVVSGSGLRAYLDTRPGFSIGPEMGINGLFMNSWMSLDAFSEH